jgi:flagellar hook-associated protein 2
MSSSGLNLNGMGLNSSTVSSGSGLDVTAVVDQIIETARGPERLWQQQQSAFSAQSNDLNTINSSLNALKTAMNALSDATGAVSANLATSSQTSILTATAKPSAAAGNHLITINSLATTASSYTDALTDENTTFETGVITLKVGTTSTDIAVDETNNTLSGMVTAINNQNLGVTASIINDANGARLALVSKTTGEVGDLTVTGNTSGLNFHKSVAGQNASLTIDGVPISSTSNTVTGAISGVTLNLSGSAPNTAVQLSVAPDTTGATQAVNNFISAYNTVIRAITAQFTVNSSTGSAGSLASNSSLRALQANLLSDVTYAMTGNNGYASLVSLGINMANDGTLSVDQTTFSGVLSSHYSDFQNFFQSLSDGFGSHFRSDLTTLTSPTQGLLNTEITQIKDQQAMLSSTITDFEDRLAARREQLIKQYSNIDAMLRQYPVRLQAITAQLATLQNYQK